MATTTELINQARADATTLMSQANTFLDALLAVTNTSFSDGFNIDNILPEAYNYATVPNTTFPVFTAPAPDIASLATRALGAAVPVTPTNTFSTIADVVVPDLTAVAPTLDIPTEPSTTLPDAPGAAPTFVAPVLPAAPAISLPAVPTFAAMTLPSAPTIDLPAFAAILPADDLLTPTNNFAFSEAAYESSLLDPLKAKLLADLTNGGYGIDTADEVALLNRARDREVELALTRIEDAGRAMAARGFPLPPGELAIHIDRSWQDMQNKVSGVSRDITIERGKRYVENRQFTIEQVKSTEQILIGFHNSVQERALNAAKATVEMAVAIFNTQRDRFLGRIERYKAEASVFAERIRGELAKAEVYRAQIEGQNLILQTNKSLVEVYIAQLKGVQVSVDIYKVQMEAAAIQAQIERSRLEAFRAQVDAYTAQVQAKVAEFGMFKARIDGQIARVTAFEGQVRGFLGQVQAAKVRSDVQLGRLQMETEQARAKIEGFRGEIAVYDADIKRLLDTGRLQVEAYRGDIDQFRALNDGARSNAELQEKALEATVQQNIQISQVTVDNAKAKLLATVEALRFKTAGVQFGAEKFYGLITATINSINALAVQSATST